MNTATNLIWNDATLAVGEHKSTTWYPLPDFFSAHGIDVIFTSTNGIGKLEIAYRLAPKVPLATDKERKVQGIILFATDDEICPVTLSLGNLRPARFINFISTVTLASITGYTLDFIQTGRG